MTKTSTTKSMPTVGQRIGVVCGPGEFPRDNAGVVLCLIEDRLGSYALVLMDQGDTRQCHSLNTGPGIGWHAIAPKSSAPAAAPAAPSVQQFEAGKTYSTRSIVDSDHIISITVASRTAKTIKTTEGKTLRIAVYEGVETVKPWGSYSMAPIVRA